MTPTIFAPLASHLGQSTLFAAMAGLLTVVLRRNRARVRYWVWLAASYKFLLPFAWLVRLGGLLEWRAAPPPVTLAVTHFTNTVSRPIFLAFSPTVQAAPQHASVLPAVMLGAWACGFFVVVAGWVCQWARIRAMVRAAEPLHFGLPIPVVSTAVRLEPGVFGIFRPVLLLPEGITGHLTRDQLQAVVAHELCHVRRRDNLAAAVHMLVEALFWFYPLVWWLGARMIDERERVCDEEVLLAGSKAQVYAESILKVCQFYAESPLHCLSGVTGSDLKKRLERIMENHVGDVLTVWKRALLASTGLIVLLIPFMFGAMLSAAAPAQLALTAPVSGKPSFEVASIKANKSSDPTHWNIALGPGDFMRSVGDRFAISNIPLKTIIAFAYKLTGNNINYLMPGLPSWVESERFDIEAKAMGTPTKDEFRLMVQSLLADRFKLTTHNETRDEPVFAVMLVKPGKMGPQMTQHTDDSLCAPMGQFQGLGNQSGVKPTLDATAAFPPVPCDGIFTPIAASAPGRVKLAGRKVRLQLLASALSGYDNFDRPMLDRTGLEGTFDLWFEFTPPANEAPPSFQPDPTGPTLQQALQEQLGLRLESQKAPIDVMVVDRLERPSEN